MPNFAAQRLNMVEGQVRANDVTDRRIQDAMASIAREQFVPEHMQSVAYTDCCLEIAPRRHLLDARCFAKLAQLAGIGPNDHVLLVGCASGYSAAVLARLARDVVALEADGTLADAVSQQLKDLENVRVVKGQLAAGFAEEAPYDVIFVNGALEMRPDSLLSQLSASGRLAAVIRASGRGRAHLFVNNSGAVSERAAFDAQVPVLPGFEKAEGFVF